MAQHELHEHKRPQRWMQKCYVFAAHHMMYAEHGDDHRHLLLCEQLGDNVLFEGGAGEIVRRKLLHECDVHTLLRLPTGVFYAQGVKANVLFFDRKAASQTSWTKPLWIYDFSTNQHFTLKTNPLKRSDVDDFVACYHPENRFERKETRRFKPFEYGQLIKSDKANLDIFWRKDESVEDSANLPNPDIIAAESTEDLEAALDQFAQIASDLKPAT